MATKARIGEEPLTP